MDRPWFRAVDSEWLTEAEHDAWVKTRPWEHFEYVPQDVVPSAPPAESAPSVVIDESVARAIIVGVAKGLGISAAGSRQDIVQRLAAADPAVVRAAFADRSVSV